MQPATDLQRPMFLLKALMRAYAARAQQAAQPQARRAAARKHASPQPTLDIGELIDAAQASLAGSGPDDDATGLRPKSLTEIYAAAEKGVDDASILDAFLRLPAADQSRAINEALKDIPPDQIPYLQDILRHELEKPWLPLPGPQTIAYNTPAQIIGYGGAAGGGKGLHVDAKVLKPSGWVRVGDVDRDHILLAPDGTKTVVLGATPVTMREAYEFEFHDGTKVICDDQHLWMGRWPGEDGWRKWSTPAILARQSDDRQFEIPLIDEAPDLAPGRRSKISPTKPDPRVHPYVMGAWIACGKVSLTGDRIWFTTPHEAVLDAVKSLSAHSNVSLEPAADRYTTRLHLRGQARVVLLEALYGYGIAQADPDKRIIPDRFLWLNAQDRLHILQALLDSLAIVDREGQCYLNAPNPKLAEQIAHLARSLGGIALPVTDTLLKLEFTEPEWFFRVERKAAMCRPLADPCKRLVKITPLGLQPCRCFQVDHPSGLFITNDFIVTHNSDLMLGLAGIEHSRSLILRREAVQLDGLYDRMRDIYGSAQVDFVKHPMRRAEWRDGSGRVIMMHHCKEPDSWRDWAGQARDFLGLDEGSEFLISQVLGLMGWVRTTKPGQRTRILLATNPPRGAEGFWFIKMFAPWLEDGWENRPGPGEVRWAIRVRDEMKWIDEPQFDNDDKAVSVEVDGELYTPQSYTFVPSRLHDNPYLVKAGYRDTLQNLPEPLRSQLLYGDFKASSQDDPWAVIPTSWVEAAMARWTPEAPPNTPMTTLAVDVAQGGADRSVLSRRYGTWFAPLIVKEGIDTKDGPSIAALVVVYMRDNCMIVIDLGGGWGGSAYDHLKNQDFNVKGFDPGTGPTGRSREGFFYHNLRAQAWWTFREALDPNFGSTIALPPNPELKLQLTMPKWKPVATKHGTEVRVEGKEDIRKRLHRSTDEADAVVMAWVYGDEGARRRVFRTGQQYANTGYTDFKRRAVQTSARTGGRRLR